MNELTVKRQYNLRTWTKIISECTNSGMTIKDWCASNDIQPARFYYWKKQIQEELVKENSLSNTFVELKDDFHALSSNKADMVLDLNGIRLEINNTATSSLISKVLKVINHV